MLVRISLGNFRLSFGSAPAPRCVTCGGQARRFKDGRGHTLCAPCANAMRNQNTVRYQPPPYIQHDPSAVAGGHPVDRLKKLIMDAPGTRLPGGPTIGNIQAQRPAHLALQPRPLNEPSACHATQLRVDPARA